MKRYRKTWKFLLIVIVLIQFIQPKKNSSSGLEVHDIAWAYAISKPVRQVFRQNVMTATVTTRIIRGIST